MSEISDAIDKLHNYDRHYVAYSDKLSNACRQLAFAEGAVFWTFKEASGLSIWIAIGLLILVCYFFTDSLQYYFGMKDYEKLADETRNALHTKDNHKEINIGSTNSRLEKCLKWKLCFIFLASVWLVFVFIKTFIICSCTAL